MSVFAGEKHINESWISKWNTPCEHAFAWHNGGALVCRLCVRCDIRTVFHIRGKKNYIEPCCCLNFLLTVARMISGCVRFRFQFVLRFCDLMFSRSCIDMNGFGWWTGRSLCIGAAQSRLLMCQTKYKKNMDVAKLVKQPIMFYSLASTVICTPHQNCCIDFWLIFSK